MELRPNRMNAVVARQRALVVSGREAEHVTAQLQHAADMLVPDPTRKRNLAIPTNLVRRFIPVIADRVKIYLP